MSEGRWGVTVASLSSLFFNYYTTYYLNMQKFLSARCFAGFHLSPSPLISEFFAALCTFAGHLPRIRFLILSLWEQTTPRLIIILIWKFTLSTFGGEKSCKRKKIVSTTYMCARWLHQGHDWRRRRIAERFRIFGFDCYRSRRKLNRARN